MNGPLYFTCWFKVAAISCCLVVSGCGDALVYGEKSGLNLSISIDPAKNLPIEVNTGLKRSVAGIVPPIGEGADGSPEGEAVNMLSHFSLKYEENNTNIFRGTLKVRSAFASGAAAAAIPEDAVDAGKVVANLVGDRIDKTIKTSDPVFETKKKPICLKYGATRDASGWQQVAATVGYSVDALCSGDVDTVDFDKLNGAVIAAGL